MINFRELKGRWKMPLEATEYDGILEIKESTSIELELQNVPWEDVKKFDETALIVQVPGALTLYKCTCTFRSNTTRSRYYNLTLKVGYILKNNSFLTTAALLFSKMSVSYSHLNDWINISGLKRKNIADEEGLFEFNYTRPDSIQISKTDDFSSGLQYSVSTKTKKWETVITEHVEYFRETNKALWHLDECVEQILLFRDFLSVILDRPINIKSIRLLGSPQTIVGYPSYTPPIFLHLPEQLAATSYTSHRNFPVKFATLKDRLGEILDQWLILKSSLQPVIEIYLEQSLNTSGHTVNRFLNIVQAIETYHRRMFINQRDMPDDLHQSRVAALMVYVPDEHREFLKGRLEYSNEPSLRKRLKEFLKKVDTDFVNHLGIDQKSIFQISNTRNYYTHYSNENESKAMKGDQLSYVTTILRAYLSYCIFVDLKITDGPGNADFKEYHSILPKKG